MRKLPEAAPQHVPEPAGESRSKPKPSAPSKRRPLPEAAPQHVPEPAGPFKKDKGFAKGGMTGLRKVFAGKETPAEERKEKVAAKKAGMSYAAAERRFEPGKHKAPAKAGMKRMMGGGNCK